MARYATTVESGLAPDDAFAYLADFSHAAAWDPGVRDARREGDAPIGLESAFSLVSRFGGRDVALRYTIVEYDPPRRLVLEATRPSFVSRDTITIEPSPAGCVVHYDAALVFGGASRALEPLFQLIFTRVGARAAAGLRTALGR